MNQLRVPRSTMHYFLTTLLFVIILYSCDHDDEAPVPEVAAISPSSAPPNTLVAITGKAFSSVFSENKVLFNGKDALVENSSSTQLNVLVPSDATTGPVTVTVNGKAALNQPVFTVESLPTVVSNISPLVGGYKTLVTITGSNFDQTPANNVVTFNGVPAEVESASPTSITVRVPVRAGTGMIVVNGVTTNNRFTYVPDVYVAGYVVDNGTFRAAYWKNGVRVMLSNTGLSTYAEQIAILGDDVYVTGYRLTGPYSVARLWKNGVEMPLGDDTHPSSAIGIFVAGNDVYVSVNEVIATKNRVVYWKNDNRVNVTDGTTTATTSGIFVNGQDIYIVGTSTHTNGKTVATYWKNGVPTLLTTTTSFALDMFVSGDDVFTTGYIWGTGPNSEFVSYWKNTTEIPLGPGLGIARGHDIIVVGKDVYVAGEEDNSKSVRIAKYWKNASPIILSDGGTYAVATCIDVIGEDVYVAGVQVNSGGVPVVTLWKNGVPFSISDGGAYATATAMMLR